MKLFNSLLFLASLSFTTLAHAGFTEDFCSNALDSSGKLNYSWFQQKRGLDPSYEIGFANDGGLMNGGVCWWHSEWTRNAIYLSILAPELPRPSSAQVKQMVNDIMNSKKVTVIGGYESLAAFTDDFQAVIQKQLNERQLRTALDFGWARGLTGKTSDDPSTIAAGMDRLYEQVNTEHKIVYQMLQLPGVDAHAWLVVGMTRTDLGYHLQMLDSNLPQAISTFDYTRGDTSEGYLYEQDPFIAYTQQDNKFGTYESRIQGYCGNR